MERINMFNYSFICLFSSHIILPASSREGAAWDGDQELSTHPSAIISMNDEESGYFEKLGARTETVLEHFFTVWGTYCASRPWFVLFCGK